MPIEKKHNIINIVDSSDNENKNEIKNISIDNIKMADQQLKNAIKQTNDLNDDYIVQVDKYVSIQDYMSHMDVTHIILNANILVNLNNDNQLKNTIKQN